MYLVRVTLILHVAQMIQRKEKRVFPTLDVQIFPFFSALGIGIFTFVSINNKSYIVIIVIMKLMHFRWFRLNRMMITWIGGTKRLVVVAPC